MKSIQYIKLSLFFIMIPFFSQSLSAVEITMECPYQTEVEKIFPLNIYIGQIENFYGASLDIVYDTNQIMFSDASFDQSTDGIVQGCVFNENGFQHSVMLYKMENNNQGRLIIGLSRNTTTGIDISEKTLMFTAYFKPIDEGSTSIELDQFQSYLMDDDLNQLSIENALEATVIISGYLLGVPQIPFPMDESINNSTSLTLTWFSENNNENTTYDIYFGKNEDPPLIENANHLPSYPLSPLENNTIYYWKITAKDHENNLIKTGPTWKFSTFEEQNDEDLDNLSNTDEIMIYKTDPHNNDTDNDGMTDGWEVKYNFNPNNRSNADEDFDNDGLSNLEEYWANTNPTIPNSQTFNVRGSVMYTGTNAGQLIVDACPYTDINCNTPIGIGNSYEWESQNNQIDYSIFIPDGSYFILAFIDINNNGHIDYFEPQGKYNEAVSEEMDSCSIQLSENNTTKYALHLGWNLITLCNTNENIYSASKISQSINEFGGKITKVLRWDGTGWINYTVGAPFGDFVLENGKGYFLYSEKAIEWPMICSNTESLKYNFHPGWNLLGFSKMGTFKASTLSQAINEQDGTITKVQLWDGTGWRVYTVNAPFGDFDIDESKGYFLYAIDPSIFE